MEAMSRGMAQGSKLISTGGSHYYLPSTLEQVGAIEIHDWRGSECTVMVASVAGLPQMNGLPLVQAALAGHWRKLAQWKVCDERLLISLVVGRTGVSTCPMVMMERYFQMSGLSLWSHDKVFREVVRTKEGERLCKIGELRYARLRNLLLFAVYGPPSVWFAYFKGWGCHCGR